MDTAKPLKRCKAETISVPVELAGQRIDNFLFTRLKGIPKTHIYRILRKGEVRVNSGRIGPSYRLLAGDQIRIPPLRGPVPETTNSVRPPQSLLTTLERSVLYEDSHLLILNKPAGIPVHGGSGLSYGVIEALRMLWQDQPKKKEIELVHRLDRETSGCLMISKRRSALRGLHALLRDGDIQKEYWTLVAGQWGGKHRVEFPLKKNQLSSGERVVKVHEEGLKAVTEFESINCFEQSTLLEAKLMTGRTHQIRVHAAHSGHPIAGDIKYGDDTFNAYMKTQGLSRLFLHAKRLSFVLPHSEERITVEAPLDSALIRVLDQLSKEGS